MPLVEITLNAKPISDNAKMYTINLIEHFEDWFVIEEQLEEFFKLEDTLIAFRTECNKLINCHFYDTSIDQFISDELDNEEIHADYSKGYLLSISKEEQTVISYHFDYDNIAKAISGFYLNECLEGEIEGFKLHELEYNLTRELQEVFKGRKVT